MLQSCNVFCLLVPKSLTWCNQLIVILLLSTRPTFFRKPGWTTLYINVSVVLGIKNTSRIFRFRLEGQWLNASQTWKTKSTFRIQKKNPSNLKTHQDFRSKTWFGNYGFISDFGIPAWSQLSDNVRYSTENEISCWQRRNEESRGLCRCLASDVRTLVKKVLLLLVCARGHSTWVHESESVAQ